MEAWWQWVERVRNAPHRVTVPILLAAFAGMAGCSLLQESVTFDETAHLVAGLAYLDRGDLRLAPDAPLARAWAALPLKLAGASVDYASEDWRRADHWQLGVALLAGAVDDPKRRDPNARLVPARFMMVLLGVALGLVVYFWALDLWGRHGALLALALYCLSPTMLAHARLVTLDAPAALGFAGTLWCLWRFCREPRWAWAIATGAALGVALLFKFSMLLLVPLVVAGLVAWAVRRRDRWTLAWATGALACVALLSWIVVWMGYGFRYRAIPDGSYTIDWEATGLKDGPARKFVVEAKSMRLLPESYLHGLSIALGKMRRRAFLDGEISVQGFWRYFPEAFLFKTTIPVLVMIAWVVHAGWKQTRGRSWDGWFLAVPIAVYAIVAIRSGMNIGHRHLTPIYPLIFVSLGGLGGVLASAARPALVLVLLLGGHAASCFGTLGSFLSYFNLLAGGARGGWHHLADSNIDWGQDLPRLRSWMQANQVRTIHLAYFGTADPRAYGIDYRKVYQFIDARPREPGGQWPARGDYLAVSVTLLHGLFYNADRAFAQVARSELPPAALAEWGEYMNAEVNAGRDYASLADWCVAKGYLTATQRARAESQLLSTQFRMIRDRWRPIGKAGDSIFIYRVP